MPKRFAEKEKASSTDKYERPFIPLPLQNSKKGEKKRTRPDSTPLSGGRGSQPFSPRQSPAVEAAAEGTRILQTRLYNLSPSSRIPRGGLAAKRKPPPPERKWSAAMMAVVNA